MIMKTSKDNEPGNRIGLRMMRCIGLLLTSCFFLGVIALAMHHHDAFFQFKNCAICKARTSFSGALSKITADTSPPTATISHCSAEIYFTFSWLKFRHQTPFIASRRPDLFLNKAPPFIS
jgi:hypothetical protein